MATHPSSGNVVVVCDNRFLVWCRMLSRSSCSAFFHSWYRGLGLIPSKKVSHCALVKGRPWSLRRSERWCTCRPSSQHVIFLTFICTRWLCHRGSAIIVSSSRFRFCFSFRLSKALRHLLRYLASFGTLAKKASSLSTSAMRTASPMYASWIQYRTISFHGALRGFRNRTIQCA